MASLALLVGCPALITVVDAPPAAAVTRAASISVAARPVLPSRSTPLGTVASTKEISGDVALVPRNAAALDVYATDVSTPGSSEYHHYLDLAAFDAKFGPTSSTIAAVEKQLEENGLVVTHVASDHLLVGFRGDASSAEAAFHTAIDRYQVGAGRTVYANASAAKLPTTVASSVDGVFGLNDLVKPEAVPLVRSSTVRSAGERAPAVTAPAGSADACTAAADTAATDSGLTAAQVAYDYGLDPLYKDGDFGQNETVDILDLAGYSPSDLSTFDKCYYGAEGARVFANDSSTNVDNGTQPGDGSGNSSETELDVEVVNAYAPKAKVDVYEAPNTDAGLLDDVAAMSASSAQLESISWGDCEQQDQQESPGFVQAENYLFEEAAARGKTVFASAGDNGSDTCSNDTGAPVDPVLSTDDPASQPFVVGVGGTAITLATDPPAEEVWNDGAAGGAGGGGLSAIWTAPAWQADSKVPGFDDTSVIAEAEKVDGNDFCGADTTCREVPDVSAQASPNTGGFPVFLDGAWNEYGGTSIASPTWAAILADIDSTPACAAGGGLGFVSPKLYAIASVPAEYAASFNDVTLGNNDNFGDADGLFPATKGYDMATGLGTPKVTGPGGTRGLAYYLCASPAAAPTITSLSTPTVSSSALTSGATLTIDGSGFSSSGASDVVGVTVGDVTIPSSDVSVQSAKQISVRLPSDLQSEENGNASKTGSAQTGVNPTDGSGTYDVTVTVAGGATSVPNANATLVIYDGSGAGTTPVVDGTSPSAGVDAGGNTVTIYGSGFSDVTKVTFGGVAARSFTDDSPDTITAVTPTMPGGACLAGDDPTTGVCQVQVQVTAGGVPSAEGTIPLEHSGEVNVYAPGTMSFAGLYPASTEFDYEPPPTLTGISFVNVPDASPAVTTASEAGGTVITITGTGLGALGLDWVNIGSYDNSNSYDSPPTYISSTEITVALPAEGPTSVPLTLPVTVQTAGSPNAAGGALLSSQAPSNALRVTYAPTPTLRSISGGVGGRLAGPTTGGAPLVITGTGFDYAEGVLFQDVEYGYPVTQIAMDIVSNSKIELRTPAGLTGVYTVEVCNQSGCSNPSTKTFVYYEPGNPGVTSDTPRLGSKGTVVAIRGVNLGGVEAVYFGAIRATKQYAPTTSAGTGDTYEVEALAPAGPIGRTVDIRVETVESLATGFGMSRINPAVSFTFTKAKPKKK